MKKIIRILTAISLAVAILVFSAWYLFVYDRDFTRDVLLSCARGLESGGNHNAAAWFYNLAYAQSDNEDAVAVELAQQYQASGNFTKAEYTLYNAIANGGGADVYIALSKLYVAQDKLLDAVTMLGSITNEQIKQQLDAMRPAAPTATPDPGFYNQYISVTLQAENVTVYYSTDGQYPSTQAAPYANPIALSDGENTIQALAVSENGLVSPLAIYGYTVGGVIELVEFADPATEAEIRSMLGVSEEKALFTNDLWGITSFTVPETAKNYADIRHMAFLETLTIQSGASDQLSNLSGLSNLTELTITDTNVSQEVLKSIAALPKLQKLTLSGCNLTSIQPLENAAGITELDLSNNTIRNIGALSGMKKLEQLYLQHNAVTDLSALSGNTALTKANLSHNSITSLAGLSSLTALTWVDASANALTELGEIGKLTALTYLSVAGNQLKNIDGLASCTALTELDISTNALTDITSLSVLNNMRQFNFAHNEVTKLPKWSKNCALVTIDGSYNKLSSLDNLGGLEHLNVVNMDYNEEIKSVSSLSKCPMLLEVNVYGTKVTDVKALTSQSIVVNYNPVQ